MRLSLQGLKLKFSSHKAKVFVFKIKKGEPHQIERAHPENSNDIGQGQVFTSQI
jgi:hypothetical protein